MYRYVPFAGAICAPILLALWTFRGPLRHSIWPALLAIAFFGRTLASDALANIRAPREWDYGCFWLYGHIAAAHRNIYDPNVFAHVALPFTPSTEFVQAVIRVGFPYPPPTIVLFLPLGYIQSLPTGLAAWYAVQVASLAAAAWILARTFMPLEGWRAATLIFAMVLSLPATQANIGNAQTNFLLLFVLALALAGRSTTAGAIWQVVAIWIKPYTVALFLIDLVRMNWARLRLAVVTAVVSLVFAAFILGLPTIATYFRSNPAGREPAFTFSESVNQSLLAMVLRAHNTLQGPIRPLHEPEYLVLAIVLIVMTAVACARAPRNSDLGFALALLLGMLLYPATLASYGVALIVPLLVLWNHRDALAYKTSGVVALVALTTILAGVFGSSFSATLALWCGVAFALATQSNSDAVIASERAEIAVA